jgi:hypothetical protein
MHWLTAGRLRVYATKGQYVCIYDPKNNKTIIYPCAWTRQEMISQCQSVEPSSNMSNATAVSVFIVLSLMVIMAAVLIVRRYLRRPGRGFD